MFAIVLLTVFLFLFVKTSKSQIVYNYVDSAGVASYNGDNIQARAARINIPFDSYGGDIALDNNGDLFIADYVNHRIRKVNKTTKIITTVVGTGTPGYNGDGILATSAQLFYPGSVTFDAANNMYIADISNYRIRKVDAITGIITTYAGNGTIGSSTTGNGGDGGLALNCQFAGVSHIALDGYGDLYFVDNYRIRKIDAATHIVNAFAGQVNHGFSNDVPTVAVNTPFGGTIGGILADAVGTLYIADGNRVRKVQGGIITTIVGHYWSNSQLYGGDGGPALAGYYSGICNLAWGIYGELYMCEEYNNLIRKYTPSTGIITTVVGDVAGGYPFLYGGYNGEGLYATATKLHYPTALAVNSVGEMYILDENRVRKVSTPCTPIVVNTNVTVCSSALPYHWAGLTLTATGNHTVHQTLASGCDSAATLHFTVLGTLPSITGATNVCIGNSVQLSDSFVGGIWSRASGGANVSTIGLVTGLAAGLVVVRYSYTNEFGCNATATYNISVNPIPTVPGMAYVAGTPNPQTGVGGAFCVGRTFKVVGYSPVAPIINNLTGVWSSSDTSVVGVSPAGSANNKDTATVVIKAAGSGVTLTYRVTSPAGCTNSRSIIISTSVICPFHRGANIEETMSNNVQFTLYPNPAHSTVILQVEKLVGAGTIVVTDLYGKQVKNQALSMGTNTIDISNLAKGFYLISTITEQGKTTKKLVVE